jgi:hypothetical protein
MLVDTLPECDIGENMSDQADESKATYTRMERKRMVNWTGT